jgi:hypothetical protein
MSNRGSGSDFIEPINPEEKKAIQGHPGTTVRIIKPNRWPLIASVMVILVLVALFAIYYIQTSNLIAKDDQLISSLQNQISTMQGTIEADTAQIKSLQSDNSTYQTQISTLQLENTAVKSQVSSLQSDNTGLRKDIASYKNQISSLESQTSTLLTQVSSVQNQLTQSNASLTKANTQLNLYKDTYGSVVASNVPMPAERVYLVNNLAAVDPTWSQLQTFVIIDKTDQTTYVLNSYDCKDFSRDVHNNAEKAGIRSGVAFISFKDEQIGHACNVFKTVDRGLVFIDCTGAAAGKDHPSNEDTIVKVKLGANYSPQFMFPERGWLIRSMGVVSDVKIYW